MIVPLALANFVCLVLGYLYPAYASFKTLESKKYDQGQFRRWLVYWVVISAFSAVELLGDNLLFWFPFYFEFKMGFVAWLVLPYFKGSAVIYHQYIEPLLEKYYPHIDTHVEKARGVMSSAFDQARDSGMRFVRSKSQGIIAGLASSAAGASPEGSSGNNGAGLPMVQENEAASSADNAQNKGAKVD